MASFQESEGEEGAIEGIIWLACRGVRFISFHCIASFRIGHPLLVRQLRGARDIEVKSSLVSPRERGGGGGGLAQYPRETCPHPAPRLPRRPHYLRPVARAAARCHSTTPNSAKQPTTLANCTSTSSASQTPKPSIPPPPRRPRPPARKRARKPPEPPPGRAPAPAPAPAPARRLCRGELAARGRRRGESELSRRGRHFPALSRKDPPFSLPPPRKPRISGPSPRPSRTSPEKLGQEEGGVNRGVEGGRS